MVKQNVYYGIYRVIPTPEIKITDSRSRIEAQRNN
uniref:Uncharacterized protein n=1 Tax=Rhizophora mucronata TaxID=61149 RepID=A0A2P2QY94_RHIMU